MIAALARPALLQLARTPRAWLAVLSWGLLGLALAALARSLGAPNGADHVLVDGFGSLVTPLLAYALTSGALGGRSLAGSTAPVIALGGSPARAAFATTCVAVASASALAALVGAAVAAVAHGVDDPPVVRDALTTAYACALGAGAYAAMFAVGSTFGRGGGGRTLLLLVDWVLGSRRGWLAVLTPRGHLRNLLGGAPPADLPERASAGIVVALIVLFAAIAVWRAHRRAS